MRRPAITFVALMWLAGACMPRAFTSQPSTPTPAEHTPQATLTELALHMPCATTNPTPTPAATLFLAPSLRQLAERRGIAIGTVAEEHPLESDPVYRQVLAREFNLVTPDYVMKFGPIHPSRASYDFRHADQLVDFAEANGLAVKGHTLVWHDSQPDWLTRGQWTRDELTGILRSHILRVVGRYRGRVSYWDVVNEAIEDDGTLRDTIWARVIGPDYIELAFRWAHEADPDALLFYNDYGADGPGLKANAVHQLAKDLLSRDVPIDGIGLQMHLQLDQYTPSPSAVASIIDRLSDLGLQVHISEMDVWIEHPEDATYAELETQAAVYHDILSVCLADDACTAFSMWGFTDKYSWVSSFFPGWGGALPLDHEYAPKPAYAALISALLGR